MSGLGDAIRCRALWSPSQPQLLYGYGKLPRAWSSAECAEWADFPLAYTATENSPDMFRRVFSQIGSFPYRKWRKAT